MSLRRINLNLLPVLQALLRGRSVSRAADSVGMSQSAASEALMQLRSTLGDPLLVRVGGGMVLTPRAVELIPDIDAICETLERFFQNRAFDPATSQRIFTVATSDYVVLQLAGPLLAAIEREAPGVSLRFVDATDQLPALLAGREADAGIIPGMYVRELAPAQLLYQTLFAEVGVAVLREGHPLAGLEMLSVTDLQPYRTLLFYPGPGAIARRNVELLMGGHDFAVAAYLTQMALPPFLLTETDYFTIVPRRLAARMASLLPLRVKEVDFTRDPVEIGLTWSPVQDADPGHRWFRGLVGRCAATLQVG